jgi:hypothetical protein
MAVTQEWRAVDGVWTVPVYGLMERVDYDDDTLDPTYCLTIPATDGKRFATIRMYLTSEIVADLDALGHWMRSMVAEEVAALGPEVRLMVTDTRPPWLRGMYDEYIF